MPQCPYSAPSETFLNLDRFINGLPRGELNVLRDNHRILWQPDEFARGGHWLLFRQQDIDYVLQTPALFTNTKGPILEDFPPEILADQQQSVTFMDPPQHRKYRSLVDGAFRPQTLRAREPVMRQFAQEIIDSVIGQGGCEFVNEVAIQFPMRVIFHVLGVRPEDADTVMKLTNTATLADDPDYAENRRDGFLASMGLRVRLENQG